MKQIKFLKLLLVWFVFTNIAFSEGSYTTGLNQELFEYDSTFSNTATGLTVENRPLYIDILNVGEVLNIHACGDAQSDNLDIEIWSENGLTQIGSTYQIRDNGTVDPGHISCTDNFTGTLLNPIQVTGLGVGSYQIRIKNISRNSGYLKRYNIAVTANSGIAVNPQDTEGRVWGYRFAFNANNYSSNKATDANYYIVTDGGFINTYYVWELNLDKFAGWIYEIMANNLGANSPDSEEDIVAGMSVCLGNLSLTNCTSINLGRNSVSPQYKVYINNPEKSYLRPLQQPTVTDFYFLDNQGNDNTISPGVSIGTEDNGSFNFVTNLETNGTYELILDTDGSGTFDSGDVYLRGVALGGTNTVVWDGKDNMGNSLPLGTYPATITVRTGEYHFPAIDAETSGGGEGLGLTINGVEDSGIIDATNNVYWDDKTARNLTEFNLDGSLGRYHNWGNFTGGGDGNRAIMDTFVYGNSDTPPYPAIVIIANNDLPLNMKVIKSSSHINTPLKAGDIISYSITVENNETVTLNNVVVTDTLPSGVNYVAQSTVATYPFSYSTGDDFSSGDYLGSTGIDNWTTNWIETDPYGNYVLVEGNRLRMNWVYVGDETIQRTVDISTFPTAELSFDWETTNLTGGENISLLISSTGGAPWTTLSTFSGTSTGVFTQDISTYISANTAIKFENLNIDWGNSNDNFYFDNLTIDSMRVSTVSDNIGGINPQLNNGTAPNLITADDNIILQAGEQLIVTFQVIVDNPLDPSILELNNSVVVSSDEIVLREANVSDAVERQVIALSSDSIEEGLGLTHTVTLNASSNTIQTYAFILENNSTQNGDYSTAYTFSSGVTYNSGTGLITVPAGVSSFNVNVPSTDDLINEDSEFYDLTIGGIEATGTILDNDALDYGDLPTGSTKAESGARHNILLSNNPYLGTIPPDSESDAIASTLANSDNTNGDNDEDGIIFLNPMVVNQNSELNVTASMECATGNCRFSGWIDFNDDGDFTDAGEHIFADTIIFTGITTLSYLVPSGTDISLEMNALFRLTTDTGVLSTGLATDGEVETYRIIDPQTLPITISYVYPQKYTHSLELDFTTSTQTANIGFNIYAINGQKWIKLNNEMIIGAMDSLTPIDYHVTLDIPKKLKFKEVGIAGVDINNNEERHGGFTINEESGEKSEFIPFDWKKIQVKVKAFNKKRKKEKRVKQEKQKGAKKELEALLKEQRVDIMTTKAGVYRVTHEELLVLGINLIGINTKTIAITLKGKGVARQIENIKKKKWTNESAIVFNAIAPKGSDSLYLKGYTYQLSLKKKLVIQSDTIEVDSIKTIVFEKNNKYAISIPGEDPFYDILFYSQGEGKAGVITRPLFLSDIPNGNVNLSIYLEGYSTAKHNLSVELNGVTIGEIEDFGYKEIIIHSVIDGSFFIEGENSLKIIAKSEGNIFDVFYYDKTILSYPSENENDILTPLLSLNTKIKKKDIKISKQTNYLIVAHPLFIGEILNKYISEKESEGWKIQLINVEDIYDAYGYGMPTPNAIKSYFQVAQKKHVTHIQLVGSANYDYHDYLGLGSISFIPSLYVHTASVVNYTPCDGCLVSDDKGIPQLAIGRWPVRSVEELNTIIKKTFAWNDTLLSRENTALLMADVKESVSFSDQMDSLDALLEESANWNGTTKIYLDDELVSSNNNMAQAVSNAREKIFESFNNGVKIVSYSGHSSTTKWSYKNLLKSSDSDFIMNEGFTALALPLACYSNYAESPLLNTIAHQFLSKGENGFVAIYGAATLSQFSQNGIAIKRVMTYLLEGQTIGEAIRQTKENLGNGYYDIIRNSNLLGDVTLKFK